MNKIKQYREALNLTQKELAEMLSLTQSTIAHYEAGRRNVSLQICRLITSIFSERGLPVTIDNIFPDEQENKK